MPTTAEMRKQISRPELERMKQVFHGIKVQAVMGERILVETVEPFTEFDEANERLKEIGKQIHMPDTIKDQVTEKPTTGIVLQLGSDMPTDGPLQEGTMVMFRKYSGDDISIEHERYRILDANEVLCVLESTEKPLEELFSRQDA